MNGSDLMDHALAVAGWPLKPASLWLRRKLRRKGTPVTIVSWDGCMGTVRNERGHGVVDRFCNQKELIPDSDPIDLVIVKLDDGKEGRYPVQWVRIVNGVDLEIWT